MAADNGVQPCPACGGAVKQRVIDSRRGLVEAPFEIRRRRECTSCHERYTTYETFSRSPEILPRGALDPRKLAVLGALLAEAGRRIDDLLATYGHDEAAADAEVTAREVGRLLEKTMPTASRRGR